jgi:hypothetical protein
MFLHLQTLVLGILWLVYDWFGRCIYGPVLLMAKMLFVHVFRKPVVGSWYMEEIPKYFINFRRFFRGMRTQRVSLLRPCDAKRARPLPTDHLRVSASANSIFPASTLREIVCSHAPVVTSDRSSSDGKIKLRAVAAGEPTSTLFSSTLLFSFFPFSHLFFCLSLLLMCMLYSRPISAF